MRELADASKARYELSLKLESAKRTENDTKLAALIIEQMNLKGALQKLHAEQKRLCQEETKLRQQYQVVASGENIAKLVIIQQKREIKVITQEIEKMRLSSKHMVDQLRLELLQARAETANLRRNLESGGAGNTGTEEVRNLGREASRTRRVHQWMYVLAHSAEQRITTTEVNDVDAYVGDKRPAGGRKCVGERSPRIASLRADRHRGEDSVPPGSEDNPCAGCQVHKRVQLRSCVFLLAQLDAGIDENAMAIIELKLEHSRAMLHRPGMWNIF